MARCFKSIDSIRDRAHAERAPSEAPTSPAVGLYYEPDDPPTSPAGISTAAPGEPSEPPAPGRRKRKARPAIPQDEEVQRFFRVIDSIRDRAIFRLIYHDGLRAS